MSDNDQQNIPVGIMSEATPNPSSYKFVVDRQIASHRGADFPGPSGLERSPLAQRLFEEAEVSGGYIGPNFVTVSHQGDHDWAKLKGKFSELIREHFSKGLSALDEGSLEMDPAPKTGVKPTTDLEKKITEILDSQVRPAVAGDGGDVIFGGFENGVLKLHLQGSCNGCPSSTMTLKMGIERLMRSQIPEVESVEAV